MTPTAPIPSDPVEMTRRLVQTPSVNPILEDGGSGEEEVARLAASWLEAWGYAPTVDEVAPGRFNVLGRRGPAGGPTLLLNGHLDTVGVDGMVHPFSGAISGGRLHGRGCGPDAPHRDGPAGAVPDPPKLHKSLLGAVRRRLTI